MNKQSTPSTAQEAHQGISRELHEAIMRVGTTVNEQALLRMEGLEGSTSQVTDTGLPPREGYVFAKAKSEGSIQGETMDSTYRMASNPFSQRASRIKQLSEDGRDTVTRPNAPGYTKARVYNHEFGSYSEPDEKSLKVADERSRTAAILINRLAIKQAERDSERQKRNEIK